MSENLPDDLVLLVGEGTDELIGGLAACVCLREVAELAFLGCAEREEADDQKEGFLHAGMNMFID